VKLKMLTLPATSPSRKVRAPLRWTLVPNPNPTAALQIVLAEERAKEWTPRDLGAREQKDNGCDIISTPPHGRDPHFIEVKAMGRPFLTKTGKWSWPDIVVRESQLAACQGDRCDSFRFEIVANLDAHRDLGAPYERLTLTAKNVVGNLTSRVQLLVKLEDALKAEIRRST
jgi:hypothetical protein